MNTVFLRAATETDQTTIRRIVRRARLNPFGLHWPRFIVAEESERIAGVGQIKLLGDGTLEIASIAVLPEYQRAGIGGAIVQTLIARADGPLYLRCARHNESYYWRFGFRTLQPEEMPAHLAKAYRMANRIIRIVNRITGSSERLLIMGIDLNRDIRDREVQQL